MELNPKLNQCLTNWYAQNDCTGKHSHDISQILPNSDIFSLTFGPVFRYILLLNLKRI